MDGYGLAKNKNKINISSNNISDDRAQMKWFDRISVIWKRSDIIK